MDLLFTRFYQLSTYISYFLLMFFILRGKSAINTQTRKWTATEAQVDWLQIQERGLVVGRQGVSPELGGLSGWDSSRRKGG